jgi:hypothetical protein
VPYNKKERLGGYADVVAFLLGPMLRYSAGTTRRTEVVEEGSKREFVKQYVGSDHTLSEAEEKWRKQGEDNKEDAVPSKAYA